MSDLELLNQIDEEVGEMTDKILDFLKMFDTLPLVDIAALSNAAAVIALRLEADMRTPEKAQGETGTVVKFDA